MNKHITITEDKNVFMDLLNNKSIKIHKYEIIPTIGTTTLNTKGNYEHTYTVLKYVVIYGPKRTRF